MVRTNQGAWKSVQPVRLYWPYNDNKQLATSSNPTLFWSDDHIVIVVFKRSVSFKRVVFTHIHTSRLGLAMMRTTYGYVYSKMLLEKRKPHQVKGKKRYNAAGLFVKSETDIATFYSKNCLVRN